MATKRKTNKERPPGKGRKYSLIEFKYNPGFDRAECICVPTNLGMRAITLRVKGYSGPLSADEVFNDMTSGIVILSVYKAGHFGPDGQLLPVRIVECDMAKPPLDREGNPVESDRPFGGPAHKAQEPGNPGFGDSYMKQFALGVYTYWGAYKAAPYFKEDLVVYSN